eukprot:7553956-Alexandrium_andersonii.AAC.1
MSASLVGSEMCIRDSPSAKQEEWRTTRKRQQPPNARKAIYTKRAGTTPVSYTHLTLPTICSV